MPRISISYRRADSQAITGRIYDRLKDRYGASSVFIDIDAIPLGTNYKDHIDETLKQTDFLLVVVGEKWLGPRNDGTYRMNDLNDPVRLELEAAMRHHRTIIPILADGASMPGPNELPDDLKEFSYINGAEVDSGRYFDVHISSVMKFLDSMIATREAETTNAKQVEEEKRAEQARLVEEAAGRDEEQRRAAEAAQRAEQVRLAEEAAQRAEQQRLAEKAAQRAEQQRLAAEATTQERLHLADQQVSVDSEPAHSWRPLPGEWQFMAARGAGAIVLGIGALATHSGDPESTTFYFAVTAYMVFLSAVSLVQAVKLRHERDRLVLALIEGLVGAAIGAAMLETVTAAFWRWWAERYLIPSSSGFFQLFSGWCILLGVLNITLAKRLRPALARNYTLMLQTGAASLIFGVVMLLKSGDLAFVFPVFVAYAILFGGLNIALSIRLRRVTL